jgi:hypothetical protein
MLQTVVCFLVRIHMRICADVVCCYAFKYMLMFTDMHTHIDMYMHVEGTRTVCTLSRMVVCLNMSMYVLLPLFASLPRLFVRPMHAKNVAFAHEVIWHGARASQESPIQPRLSLRSCVSCFFGLSPHADE